MNYRSSKSKDKNCGVSCLYTKLFVMYFSLRNLLRNIKLSSVLVFPVSFIIGRMIMRFKKVFKCIVEIND